MSTKLHESVAAVTQRIEQRSESLRGQYLDTVAHCASSGRVASMSCSNVAHVTAAMPKDDKFKLVVEQAPNLGVVSAYNDMLSAHQPFQHYPDLIKKVARDNNATAQVAGGVPAMCDGVTQGEPGMELSLFSRDVIAMSAGVALSHNVFDGAIFLGVCDKIVPGLVIAAGTFGHLPVMFLPAGPMVSGISNAEKARVRQQYAAGEIDRATLLEAEMGAYHDAGTCTFYGTANTNQMLMEFMGLQLPGSSFINPYTEMRDALTVKGTEQLLSNIRQSRGTAADILTAKAFVNGMVGLHATGGSTNLLLHLVAMARAVGLTITAADFAELSAVTPLLARVYPNGQADVNHFHAAGGLQFVIGQLLDAGLLHEDVETVAGTGLSLYRQEAFMDGNGVQWRAGTSTPGDTEVVRTTEDAFAQTGGLLHLTGEIGEAVMKVSAVAEDKRDLTAPAKVFNDQVAVKQAFEAGELTGDFVCVVRFQGPRANGMPELHSLSPILGLLQDRGQRVALLTDGRMSGASGKVPAAIHLSPEAALGGWIGRIQDGDMIGIDTQQGTITVEADLTDRQAESVDLSPNQFGIGREMFSVLRNNVSTASDGAHALFSSQNGTRS